MASEHQSQSNSSQSGRMNGAGDSGSRSDSIKKALKTLDAAIQGEAGSLGDMITDEYVNLKSALKGYGPKVSDEIRNFGSQAYERATDAASQGMARGREVVEDVDGRIRDNLWPTLGGVAASALALGFVIGYSRRPSSGSHD